MEHYSLGCLPPKTDIRDFQFKASVIDTSNLPDTFCLEKKAKVKNQRSISSCVAHASSTILEYHNGGNVELSTNFIYGIHHKLYGTNGPGMYLRDACKIMNNLGDPEEIYCQGNTEVTKVYEIAEKAYNDSKVMEFAEKHKIKSYAKVSTDDEIKYAIYNHGPVLACVKWYDGSKLKNNILTVDKTHSFGYHAIVLLGWNEVGFIAQNSWGKSYGDNGYFILPYNHGIAEAYSIISDDNTEDDLQYKKINKFIDLFYKLVNLIINLFRKK